MTVIAQVVHLVLIVALAPAITGLVRWVKARALGRAGPAPWQPYRDLRRLMLKTPIVAETSGPLYTAVPYLQLAAIWLAAAMVPAFTYDLPLAQAGDLIVLAGILGLSRFLLALAGLDAGTAFGGIGSSRELMIGALAEPAMLLVVFTVAVLVHTTSLPAISAHFIAQPVGLRVSLGMALVAIVIVAVAENGRIPIDNPATHLELTMVHEAMVLDYSGRHLAAIELASMLKLVVWLSLIQALFVPFGMAGAALTALALPIFVAKLAAGAVALALFEVGIAKMRVFRYPEFLGGAVVLGMLATIYLYVSHGF
ncbi:MAG: NADH-quinone oxidoreductase subunit H [Alphaproteobacteria bacterium]|jgi:formate hydrogenlyase subunit 4|nr:NADH-quinone oxidoreductase subunit H [Alphaproteobacteria bacterium]